MDFAVILTTIHIMRKGAALCSAAPLGIDGKECLFLCERECRIVACEGNSHIVCAVSN